MSSYGSVNAILPLLEYLVNEGFDLGMTLDRAGIPRTALEDTKTRFPKHKFQALWQVASEATGDPAVALRVSTMVKPNTLGIIGYLAAASESGRNAYELVRGLTPLLWEDVDCQLVESDDDAAFIRCSTGGHPRTSHFTTEYAIGLTITMSRALGVGRPDPLEARFSYAAPSYADEYERILRLPVVFEAGEDGVLFPISMMDGSNPSADAALRQLLERHAAEQLARISTPRFSERVRACILSMLPLGGLTADAVAARFSMSNRTLRRRLREEATSYQEILDDVRAELACDYLTKQKRGIDEVAFLLGSENPSAFTKAFRRWTGRTPADFARAPSS